MKSRTLPAYPPMLLFSDFLRRPGEAVNALGEHDVLLSDVALRASVTLGAALRDEFPWADHLPGSGGAAFAEELTRALLVVTSVDGCVAVVQLLREWEAAAEVQAHPEFACQLMEPLEAAASPVRLSPG